MALLGPAFLKSVVEEALWGESQALQWARWLPTANPLLEPSMLGKMPRAGILGDSHQGLWRNTLDPGIKAPDKLGGQRLFLTFRESQAQQETMLRLEGCLRHWLVVTKGGCFWGMSYCLLSLS